MQNNWNATKNYQWCVFKDLHDLWMIFSDSRQCATTRIQWIQPGKEYPHQACITGQYYGIMASHDSFWTKLNINWWKISSFGDPAPLIEAHQNSLNCLLYALRFISRNLTKFKISLLWFLSSKWMIINLWGLFGGTNFNIYDLCSLFQLSERGGGEWR